MLPFASRIVCQTLLLLSLLNTPATATQVWIGAGRITDGIGQGGSVKLKLEIEGNHVRSIYGFHLNGAISNGTISTKLAHWRFRKCSQDLCVTLNRIRPKQTIFYRLHRTNK
ncbi:hypothetical protein Osc7112_3857 [Oscillatoria nigro-viridis PCC 7112]|uniref:Uncharacterized protein n=1 Tax=Phormidium nigroviride PCC 7112 TaxID=179408 RepID=K9VJC0_9CYAN|nr:hypothetical protein Osc7112_3857 [Oscillatoria nigro-viridis PCC 7112]